MKPRSKTTLQKYGLTEEAFAALWEAQNGCCAICGMSEAELEQKHSAPDDWPSDRMLHIDHQKGTQPRHVRGLLCWSCNFDLEAFTLGLPLPHPGRRGRFSIPRYDPRFVEYLRR